MTTQKTLKKFFYKLGVFEIHIIIPQRLLLALSYVSKAILMLVDERTHRGGKFGR